MTYARSFHIKVKVKGQCQGHYPAKLLKHFRFSQNVFTFLIIMSFTDPHSGLKIDIKERDPHSGLKIDIKERDVFSPV